MKNSITAGLLLITTLFMGCQQNEKEPLSQVIERGLQRATEQAILMAKELENQEGVLPRSTNPDGTLMTSDYHWWCSGFFPGELWYLYENNPTEELKKFAALYTDRVEDYKNVTYTHDIGFVLNCSFGNGYRLTGNPHYADVMVTGSNSLISRYNEQVGAIRSWDFNTHIWQFPVIIDNMMNLELLTWTSRYTGNPIYGDIACAHADKTIDNHFRDDYSTFHVVSYDTITGNAHIHQTHQGYSDESSWARGQAWAIYGYTMMYRETGKKAYFEQAKNIANFIMHHPNMPEDKIPYWDFDAPDIPNTPRDASAGALIASALIELSQMESSSLGKEYLAFAEDQIRSLTSPAYLAEAGKNNNFVLMHSTGHLPGDSEVDVPLSYADYYYVEALMRLKKLSE